MIELINRMAKIDQPLITPAASNLLFSSNFAANTALDAYVFGGAAARRNFTNAVDNQTGFRWPYNGGSDQALDALYSSILFIRNGVTLSGANVGTYGTFAITDATGPDDTTEKVLDMSIIDGGAAWNSQMNLEFQRIGNGTGLSSPDLNDFYFSYYFKRPASFLSALSVGQVAVQWDVKTGGFANLYGGDLRFYGMLYKGSDGFLYSFAGTDKHANGTMTHDPSGIIPFAPLSTPYWLNTNKTVQIPVDEWVKAEVYIHRHATKGLCLVAYNDQITCQQIGRTLGEYGNKIGRIFPFSLYSQLSAISGSMCRLRFYDYPPGDSVLQMPAARLLYKYAA